jgi:sulfur carrier protein
VKASINGEEHDLPDGLTVAQLLVHLQAPERGIAVAKNDRVVRRAMFEQERVNEGDRVEIIKAVAGG